MLAGEIIRCEENAEAIVFIIRVPEDGWRTALFDKENKVNIHFPYPPVYKNGNEMICPTTYWDNVSGTPSTLDDEEAHFREHSVNILKNIIFDGCLIYDPACSTGMFLSYIRNYYQSCCYFASDRSASMVEIAKKQLPNIFICDIMSPTTKDRYDIIFCRFLNQEVIASTCAGAILSTLFTILK